MGLDEDEKEVSSSFMGASVYTSKVWRLGHKKIKGNQCLTLMQMDLGAKVG